MDIADTIFCMASGYVYMWFARFGDSLAKEDLFLMSSIIEVYFCLSMYVNFVTDYVPDGQIEPVRNLVQISKRYLKGDFIMQFIPLIPFTYVIELNNHTRLLFLIKVLRVINGMKVLDVQTIFSRIQVINRRQSIKNIKKNPMIGEDTS